jgi:hypothetical protein
MAEQEQEILEITPGQFKEWSDNPITQEIVKQIVELRNYLQRYLAEGKTAGKDPELSTDRVFGRIEGLTEVFNIFTEAKDNAREKVSNYDH